MMRPSALLPFVAFVLPFAGCDLAWWDSEEESDTIWWSGSVLDGPYTGENGDFTGGTFLVEDLHGELVAEAEEGSVGSWNVELPPDVPVAIRLAADGMIPTLWRATTPGATSYWFTGALFAYEEVAWTKYLLQFDGKGDLTVGELGPDTCWLWGSADISEDWVGAEIGITDGAGKAAPFLATWISDDGLMYESDPASPVDYFFAFDLAAGDITIRVAVPDGRVIEVVYPGCGGEIISAWFLALPLEAD